jgi:hypothetical protein
VSSLNDMIVPVYKVHLDVRVVRNWISECCDCICVLVIVIDMPFGILVGAVSWDSVC